MANMEMRHGFFVALICGPNLVMPHDYQPVALGSDHAFANEADACANPDLLMSRRNVMANLLR